MREWRGWSNFGAYSFLISDDGTTAEFHLVRSNPIARQDLPQSAVISIQGPHGYASPDWYEVADQVPTWNYVAVHLRGQVSALPASELHRIISDLSNHHEARLAPKPIWTSDKMDPEIYQKMQRQIIPMRMMIERVDGTWKLNQNKPDEVRLRAAQQIETGHGSDLQSLSNLMRNPPKT